MLHRSILKENRRFPLLTLQEMSFIKIVTMLCNHPQLRRLILKCKFHDGVQTSSKLHLRRGEKWEAVEGMAYELVSQVCKPALLQKKILEFLWPVCYRITLWKSVYAHCINNSFLEHFHWTDRGRINNTRTVSCLVKNRNISVRERFALACSVCLKDGIYDIWMEMSAEDRANLYAEYRDGIFPLIRFWSHTFEGSFYVHEPYVENALVCATTVGLLEAVKYLFFIAPEDEMAYLTSLCSYELNTKLRSGNILEEDENDIQYFVFSLMKNDLQRLTFEGFTETALSLLLHSSKYELCLQLMAESLGFVSMENIARALKVIFYTYHLEINSVEDCRFLFMDVWKRIPNCMKRDKTLGDLSVEILLVLTRDNFPFLFEPSSVGFEFFGSDKPRHFHEGKWNLLLFIIDEGITISFLKKRRKKILSFWKKSVFCEGTFNHLLRLVLKVQRRNQAKPIG